MAISSPSAPNSHPHAADEYIAIFGALGRELDGLRSEILACGASGESGRDTDFWTGVHHGCPVALVRTGVGAARASQAARAALSSLSIRAMLSVGYAGALREGMDVGHLVVGERVMFFESGAGDFYESDARLVGLAGPPGDAGGLRRGTLLTVPRVVERSSEKRDLAARSGALALDMESAAVARAAAGAKVPFLCIRVVSDRLDEDLAGLSRFLAPDGSLRVFRGLLYAFSRPSVLGRLWRLGVNTEAASRRLGRFVHEYLHRLN